jgi:hypothetical protein
VPGIVSLSISNNELDFSSSTAEYTYEAMIMVNSVRPSRGPVEGGTIVEVTGTRFFAIFAIEM